MKALLPAVLSLSLVAACVDGPQEGMENTKPEVRDTSWIADLRMTAVDTTVRMCGTGRRYRLIGPAMDTTIIRYKYANVTKGQWMKFWFMGHPTAITTNGIVDSAMYASKFLHIDASLSCDPVPDPRIAGSYILGSFEPTHPRTVMLDLFGDGTAIMYTDLHNGNGVFEEDGTWGTDVTDKVNVRWPQRDQTMIFRWNGTDLESAMATPGPSVSMRHTGAIDAARGSIGRAMRWIDAAAASTSRNAAHAVLPSSQLTDLLLDEASNTRLASMVRDSLQQTGPVFDSQWAQVHTVGDLSKLIRAYGRR